MFILYDLVFILFALMYLPFFLCKRKMHNGFFMRLGILPHELKAVNPIWIHAVSVGEVMAMRSFIEQLRLSFPNRRIFISTVTSTGNRIARRLVREGEFVFYLPLDISFVVKKVIDRIDPSFFILAETEIWPNLISYLNKKNIPLAVVNARISDSSFKGYRAAGFLLKNILNKANLFCVQTQCDAGRLRRLGLPESKIRVTGNMKFDNVEKHHLDSCNEKRISLGIKVNECLWVAGSTHKGEEEIILNSYKILKKEFSGLRLLIAPRHPERAKDIHKLVVKSGYKPVFTSLSAKTQESVIQEAVYILDTIGELASFYSISDIVFVGGSLIKKGGHNILEPASFGKPVLFGQYMFNFRDIAELFLNNKSAISVSGEIQLQDRMRYLLSDPSSARDLGNAGRELFLRNQGASSKNLEYVKALMQAA